MAESLLTHYLPADYHDSYHRKICSGTQISPEELLKDMFSPSLSWVKGLLKIRDILVKPLGLETGKMDISGLIKEKSETLNL